MKSENRSQAFLRKRKMMLVLPLLVIPFLTMAFWALGGGSVTKDEKPVSSPGLNLDLPSSAIKDDKDDNKLSFYDRAQRDSAKLEEWMRNDPYYKNRKDTLEHEATNALQQITNTTATKFNQQLNSSPYETSDNDPEQKLMQKIALLQKELAKPTGKEIKPKPSELTAAGGDDVSKQMNRLQDMMEGLQPNEKEDPEMQRLGNTLDKILDIQHPQRVKERLKGKSLGQRGVVFTVNKTTAEEQISLFGMQKQNTGTGFYGIETSDTDTTEDNGIQASAYMGQTVVNGAVIKFRLLHDVYINGKLAPKGTFATGTASLDGERLNVEINSIRVGNTLLPVRLAVYDLDGLSGIYIPGAISRDIAKQSADNSLQLLELSTMDPSPKTQLVATGLNAGKNLLSRKAKQIKVFVKAGYKVLLKNTATGE